MKVWMRNLQKRAFDSGKPLWLVKILLVMPTCSVLVLWTFGENAQGNIRVYKVEPLNAHQPDGKAHLLATGAKTYGSPQGFSGNFSARLLLRHFANAMRSPRPVLHEKCQTRATNNFPTPATKTRIKTPNIFKFLLRSLGTASNLSPAETNHC